MSGTVKQRLRSKKLEQETKPDEVGLNKNKEKTTNVKADEAKVKIDFKRIVIRCIIIIGIISIVSLSQKESDECFAKASDQIDKKSEEVPCSQDYVIELSKFPGCAPKRCGRMVSDSVINPSEVQALQIMAEKGFSLSNPSGGASILDLHSGALSQGNSFVDVYKIDTNHKIINKEDIKLYKHIKNKIKSAIVKHFGVSDEHLYLTKPTFFSRLTSVPAQTLHDEYWHPHVDKETYSSFHYTSLVYLADYQQHFKGGRFIFVDNPLNKTIEPKSGRLSAFTSGSENLHYIEKVTSGTRYAITISFTCDPKHAISDPKISK